MIRLVAHSSLRKTWSLYVPKSIGFLRRGGFIFFSFNRSIQEEEKSSGQLDVLLTML